MLGKELASPRRRTGVGVMFEVTYPEQIFWAEIENEFPIKLGDSSSIPKFRDPHDAGQSSMPFLVLDLSNF